MAKPLSVLAADIGGTHARFAACEVDADFTVRQGPVLHIETRHPDVRSFRSLWAVFLQSAPPALADRSAFDAVALAVAGSVDAEALAAVLPNIDWDITADDVRDLGPVHLLNDFVAQGYALAAAVDSAALRPLRAGADADGCIALVGAGTGLGQCALYAAEEPGGLRFRVAGSEAGHATFAFHGEQERAIEDGMLRLSGRRWLDNDQVVSGPGSERLHEVLTGRHATAAVALAESSRETVAWFSRFYARACRNYCLSVFPVRRLVVSGGLAARSPHLVRHQAFFEEFNDGGDFRPLLERIPIWLNTDQDTGIRGAAVYAAARLRRNTTA